jgi:hypothetical protein
MQVSRLLCARQVKHPTLLQLPEHDRSDVAVGLLRDVVIPVIDARVQLSVMACYGRVTKLKQKIDGC